MSRRDGSARDLETVVPAATRRNDYMMWIRTAKQQSTRQRRLNQMLHELERGGIYMKMAWKG